MPACSMVIFPGRVAIHLRCASVPAIITAKYSVHNKYSVFTSHGHNGTYFVFRYCHFSVASPGLMPLQLRELPIITVSVSITDYLVMTIYAFIYRALTYPHFKRYLVRIVFEEFEKAYQIGVIQLMFFLNSHSITYIHKSIDSATIFLEYWQLVTKFCHH